VARSGSSRRLDGPLSKPDPVGDMLETPAQNIARDWRRVTMMTVARRDAYARARAGTRGYARAMVMERQFRGQYVERMLRERLQDVHDLKWASPRSGKGIDLIHASGRRYNVLSGTQSEIYTHVRRMPEETYRMIMF
jgi:hypothetical protein